jgi:hypothetical protein
MGQQAKAQQAFHAHSQLLGGLYLYLDKDSAPEILNHIDCFVSQSKCNESVEEMELFPYSLDGHDDDASVRINIEFTR